MLSYDFLRTMAMNTENRLDIHRGLGVQFLIPCLRRGYHQCLFFQIPQVGALAMILSIN
jgi:hypothetical protein